LTRRLSTVESNKRQGIDPSPYYRVLHDNGNVLENIRFPGTKSNYPLPGISYQPLDFVNFEFRLLTLLKNEDSSQEGQICCELKHAYLDDPPQYYALSYCWGDPTVIAPITEGHKVKMSQRSAQKSIINNHKTTARAHAPPPPPPPAASPLNS
jgi:hypothetical protein